MATLPRPIQALPLLRQLKLDDTELIAALISVGEAGYAQTSERTYEIRSADSLIAEVRLNRTFQLISVMIPCDVWRTIRPKISADAELNQTRIARTILFTYRPPTGYAQIPGWLQLRPVACDLKDATGLGATKLQRFSRYSISLCHRSSFSLLELTATRSSSENSCSARSNLAFVCFHRHSSLYSSQPILVGFPR